MPTSKKRVGSRSTGAYKRITREMRRKRQNQLYDNEGKLLDGRDVCDCLEEKCPGCHFPCPRCRSEKCGDTCRCNRQTYIGEVEVEGANFKLQFPGNAPKPAKK